MFVLPFDECDHFDCEVPLGLELLDRERVLRALGGVQWVELADSREVAKELQRDELAAH